MNNNINTIYKFPFITFFTFNFRILYTIIFKEEVPHTGLKSGDDEVDLVIEAIIENKKIEAVKIDDRFTGVRE